MERNNFILAGLERLKGVLIYVLRQPMTSAEAFSEIGRREKITLKNGDFLIASKMRSIHFSNFHSLTPKKVHRAPF
ncbi:MAG: hypothetical protein IKZ11_04790 [Alistipes sp.]|nr:hypothetical protein [Alistipes sp.]